MTRHAFTDRVIQTVRDIPAGKVATYGQIARLAGSPRAARQVARILHACSAKEGLPWHRVVNREGRIALKPLQGFEEQKRLLEREGILLDSSGAIDLLRFLWLPRQP
jgi:methylated-DNA-protein-cysteine methyltransferase-like protein